MTETTIESIPLVNMAAFMEHSKADGPGCRAVVWVQGCHRRCPGCGNPDMQAFVEKALIEPHRLAERILNTGGIEGVTFSGGEPFEQADALALVAEVVRDAGLNVVAFSGYTLGELRDKDGADHLLEQTDLLIDGPFVREIAGNDLWRGSANQKLHFLTGRIRPVSREDRIPRTHMAISQDMRVQMSGFPAEEFVKAVEGALGSVEPKQGHHEA